MLNQCTVKEEGTTNILFKFSSYILLVLLVLTMTVKSISEKEMMFTIRVLDIREPFKNVLAEFVR